MGKLKAILGISAIAGAIAAVFAYKRKKDLEEYEYEEFDECFCDDCCYPDEESAEEAIKEAEEEAIEDLSEVISEEVDEEIAEDIAEAVEEVEETSEESE